MTRIFFQNEKVIIGTPDAIAQSPRTKDIKLNDLAKDEKLLQSFDLVSMYAKGKKSMSAEEFLTIYLAAFNSKAEAESFEYLQTNPTLRLLIF